MDDILWAELMNISERERLAEEYGQKIWLKTLTGIKRYVAKEQDQKPLEMVHRPDVWLHARRVMFLSDILAEIVTREPLTIHKPDLKKISYMGYHHDDPEIITGDFLAIEKGKMNKDRLQKLEEDEDVASSGVGRVILGLTGSKFQAYVEEQREIRNKQTLESQIVDIADKWDAACEIMHDIRCGNRSFASLLSHTKNKFAEFGSKYSFYNIIKSNPQLDFDNISDPQQVLELPTISISDLKTPEDLAGIMSPEGTKGWPASYATWAALNVSIFDKRPEKFIFPGWYMQLWANWRVFPSGTTTTSGLLIP